MTEKKLFLNFILVILLFCLFSLSVFAWFTASNKNNVSDISSEIINKTNEDVVITDVNGDALQSISLPLKPNEYSIFALKVTVATNVDISTSITDVITTPATVEEEGDLYNVSNYKFTKVLNQNSGFYYGDFTTESLFEGFVQNADIAEAIQMGVIITKTNIGQNAILTELESSEIVDTINVVYELRNNKTLDEYRASETIFDNRQFENGDYYVYLVAYYNPYIYPMYTVDGVTYELQSSNAYLYQDITFSFSIENN